LTAFVRPFSPIRLTERDRQDHFGRFRMAVFKDGMKTIVPKPPDVILKNTEFPETLPPYRGLTADGEGNIWVHVYVESRATNVFDVFDPQSGFIARITVDGGPVDHSLRSLSRGSSAKRSGESSRTKRASLVKYLTAGRTSR
jgi:hypothetical protein